jgi:hypothetical protein
MPCQACAGRFPTALDMSTEDPGAVSKFSGSLSSSPYAGKAAG